MTDIIARCGFKCNLCLIYRENLKKDEQNRQKFRDGLEKYYGDGQNGGFFMTGNDHEALIVREKPVYDGAEPSGNSVAVLNLLRLGEFTFIQRNTR